MIYTDPRSGKRHDLQRRADSRRHAERLRDELVLQVSTDLQRLLPSSPHTFQDLARLYLREFVVPAEYRGGEKIAGMRDQRTVKAHVKLLVAHLQDQPLNAIGYGDLRALRTVLLDCPTSRGTRRSVANVHRVLACLRRMLNVAVEERWLSANPFEWGRPLILTSAEAQRERVLSYAEEARLLAACQSRHRLHLRALIVAALDTGMRFGELIRLTWDDIDLTSHTILVQKTNTKTLRERRVGMTQRVKTEIEALRPFGGVASLNLVFGVRTNVKRSFQGARRDADLKDLRFHDLRHTAATRLVQGGLPLAEVARILGHSQISTTYRYVNADCVTLHRATAILERQTGETERERSIGASGTP